MAKKAKKKAKPAAEHKASGKLVFDKMTDNRVHFLIAKPEKRGEPVDDGLITSRKLQYPSSMFPADFEPAKYSVVGEWSIKFEVVAK